MALFEFIARSFQNGGIFMYPILIVGALGLSITAERVWYLTRARAENRSLWLHLLPLIREGRFDDARELAGRSKTAIGHIVGHGLMQVGSGASRERAEAAVDESLLEMMPALARRTHYLATFSNIATLLGLLGTIVGMIHGFSAVGELSPADRQGQLSAAVSQAMNCTAFGLVVAIPMMLIHAWLQSLTDEISDRVEVAAVKFVNDVAGRA
ncbi:MotA/TolQ/ExbB proton channel family protein [Burkholderia anthina]|uniref:MotA/TolQ/ExbB proton channel family protein n=1 Tax=Burkholderia anthina TaxID=179879 RepID=UPI00158A13FE|nr:MotA/TolQ/ExbB proton channel family protein [Burkholderia anthina]